MSSTSPLAHEGVSYLPAQDAIRPSIPVNDLELHGIRYVRIQWVDLVNTVRIRVVPLAYFKKLVRLSRPGVSIPKVALGIVFLTVAEGFSPVGDWVYTFDLSSIKICPYAPGHASVMGWFEVRAPNARLPREIEVDLCPRTILRRVTENAKKTAGVEFLVGFETEFILLKNTNPIEAVNPHGWSNASAFPSGTTETQVLEEIADALGIAGIELQMYHSEAAPGQYEIVTGPLQPLQAADALVHTRETIYNIASKHGLRATLAPRVHMNSCGSAAHTHISVHTPQHKPGASAHTNLNKIEASFLAGVLEYLPSLTLLALPLAASYKRMQDGIWSGGTYVSWGTENKESPVRLCNAHSPSSRNFELKTSDGTANPYLLLAGVLGAGLNGIVGSKELTIQDCSGGISAALLGEEERAKLGIKDRFPLTWEAACSKFEESGFVASLFGSDFKKKFLSLQKVANQQMTDGLNEEEALQLLIENY